MKKLIYSILISMCILFVNATAQWEACNNGLNAPKSLYIHSLTADDNKLFIGTNDGVYFSSDKGNTWIQRSNGLYLQGVWRVSFFGNYLLAGGWGGVYLSTDFGENWIQKNNGIIDSVGAVFACDADRIYLGTSDNDHGGRVYSSSDTCANWIQKNMGLNFTRVKALAIKGDSLFASIDKSWGNHGVFLTTDKGDTWISKSKGIDKNVLLMALIVDGDNMYLGTYGQYGGVYLSTDFGDNWIRMNNGLLDTTGKIDPHVYTLLSTNNALFTGISERGVYVSTDKANSWHEKINGLTSLSVQVLTATKDYIYAGTYGGVFRAKFEDLTTNIPDKIHLKSEITISPNPSSDFIELSKPSEGSANAVRIFNVFGERVVNSSEVLNNSQFSIHNSQLRIDVSGLPSGVYIVRIGDKVSKFIKI